ncbi:hypothetical protein SPRG_13266 [Saprolegnia parasitica CBS 223.65]|uniref:Uncharacterized protein n=1 Tax=Saprolegnia parasitica (strain CBS 223.65) TaxID=695850 RepID=A0A067C458_SAPPC|nr:hypothetical protein SPRG_13266 [Saprolegnia parasitica CBS 223.65]KDO21582.1 hypothetical protein SPRG_13266 [Saprolegnia parasitica CBS 223.65]|eukprot:XP_012207673.1 hypothetical protein SPRG_13266 [Saprolegnia parasitica CBS 223.65]
MNEATVRELVATGWHSVVEDDSVAWQPTDPPYSGYSGPTPDVLRIAGDPLALFFHFMPKEMWKNIAHEANNYWRATIQIHAEKAFERPGNKKTLDEIEKCFESSSPDVAVASQMIICR